MTILEAMRDEQLFAPWFKEDSWAAWRAFLAALFGLEMTEAEAAIFRQCTGRKQLPGRRGTETPMVTVNAAYPQPKRRARAARPAGTVEGRCAQRAARAPQWHRADPTCTDEKAIELIEELSKVCDDAAIAQVLNRLGYRTGSGADVACPSGDPRGSGPHRRRARPPQTPAPRPGTTRIGHEIKAFSERCASCRSMPQRVNPARLLNPGSCRAVIEKILRSLGLSSELPKPDPARHPPWLPGFEAPSEPAAEWPD